MKRREEDRWVNIPERRGGAGESEIL